MMAYLAKKPKGKFGTFEYKSPDAEAISTERKAFQRYQDYFKVPNEV